MLPKQVYIDCLTAKLKCLHHLESFGPAQIRMQFKVSMEEVGPVHKPHTHWEDLYIADSIFDGSAVGIDVLV